jgi:hypothetical protein
MSGGIFEGDGSAEMAWLPVDVGESISDSVESPRRARSHRCSRKVVGCVEVRSHGGNRKIVV